MSPDFDRAFSLDDDEEDIENSVSAEVLEDITRLVVFGVDWTVGTVLDQLRSHTIELQPQYQRRDAWTLARKSKLIESLILGLPVPHVVLAERPASKGSFVVLDGKQRLTALLQFSGTAKGSPSNGFPLTDLPILKGLNGKTFQELSESEELVGPRNAFLNQPVRSSILRGWSSEELLHLVFHRLNANVVPLSPQELRQALIPGPFLPYLNDYSADSLTTRWLLRLDGPDFRMRDSELLLRLLAFAMYSREYRGDLRRFLDRTAKDLNSAWPVVREVVDNMLQSIEASIEVWGEVLGRDNVGRKYGHGQYERRFNRAVLDSQVAAGLNDEALAAIKSDLPRAKHLFENLMSQDEAFLRSIEATTKSIDAVHIRRTRLLEALRSAP